MEDVLRHQQGKWTMTDNRVVELLELMEAADEDKLIEIAQELYVLTESYETRWMLESM
jgi:hypothetical protein